MIFTENGMFEQVRGVWRTGQALRNQRVAGRVGSVMKRMGLSDCNSAGMDDIDGQKTWVYTYSQDPDIRAKIWISDDDGLPLRAELQQSPGRDNNPVKVSMRYAYNDDVHVPNDAALRNWMRKKYSWGLAELWQAGRPAAPADADYFSFPEHYVAFLAAAHESGDLAGCVAVKDFPCARLVGREENVGELRRDLDRHAGVGGAVEPSAGLRDRVGVIGPCAIGAGIFRGRSSPATRRPAGSGAARWSASQPASSLHLSFSHVLTER